MSNHALPPQRDKQPRPPANSEHPAFGRRWFGLVRMCTLAIMLIALGVFVLSLPVYYAQLQTLCPDSPLTCTFGQLTSGLARTFLNAGLSLSTYATLIITVAVLSALICVTVAVLLLWHTSRNWMALLVAFNLVMEATDNVTGNVVVIPSVLGPWMATIFIPFSNFLYTASTILVFSLFPNGRFVPRWMRWLTLIYLAVTAIFYLIPQSVDLLGFFGGIGLWFSILISVSAAQIYRYRRVSTPLERQQTKVVVFAFAVSIIVVLALYVPMLLVPSLRQLEAPYTFIGNLVGGYCFTLLLAVALGIAILRYRLYDIDIVINRTLVYGTLTVSILGIYVLVVGLLGILLQAQGNLLISLLATGLVAVLFQPLRARLQRLVNRLMYGDRDTPYQAIAHLGQHLEATLTSDAVLPTIVETVAHALKLPYVAMSLKQDEVVSTAAAFGVTQEPLVHLPLLYQGEQVGELLLAPRAPGEAFSSADRKLLEDLARQAGMTVHAVDLTRDLKRLTQDLQHSRTALVTLREEERRRLRRDLHDGLGSALASLNWRAGALRQALTHDPTATHALVAEQQTIIRSTLADIRRLLYDLRPPSLDELGLVGALRERAAHATIPTSTDVDREYGEMLQVSVEVAEGLPPLPAAIEVAAYRIVQEALANVVRHAHAATCQVQLSVLEGALHVEVTDDGVGVAVGQQVGVGFLSMQERAAELGGSCHIQPGPKGGTQVCAHLPLLTD